MRREAREAKGLRIAEERHVYQQVLDMGGSGPEQLETLSAAGRAGLRGALRPRRLGADWAPDRKNRPLAGLFGEVLGLCAEAGLARVGVVAVDGTKVHANASRDATRDYEQIAEEILAEADAVDREEDERFGEARGDELPPQLSTHQGRRGWLRDARRRLDEKRRRGAADRAFASRAAARNRSGGWRRSWRRSAALTRTMRPIGRAG